MGDDCWQGAFFFFFFLTRLGLLAHSRIGREPGSSKGRPDDRWSKPTENCCETCSREAIAAVQKSHARHGFDGEQQGCAGSRNNAKRRMVRVANGFRGSKPQQEKISRLKSVLVLKIDTGNEASASENEHSHGCRLVPVGSGSSGEFRAAGF